MEEANASSRSNSKGQKNKADKELGTGYGVHRGLDFQNVSFVINFDFPATSAAYTHRIGRTARGGASGTALSFVSLPHIPGDGIREDDNSERDLRILQEVQHQQPRLGKRLGYHNLIMSWQHLRRILMNMRPFILSWTLMSLRWLIRC